MTPPVIRYATVATATLIIVLAAITTGLSPEPIAPASAQEVLADCEWTDTSYVGFLLMAFRTVTDAETGCRVNKGPDFSDVTPLDLYSGARTIGESQATTLAAIDNHLTDARSTAFTEAKIAMVNELNAGGNKEDIRRAAYASIEDFYSPMYANINSLWIQKVSYVQYAWRANQAIDGYWVDAQFVALEQDPAYPNDIGRSDVNLADRLLTLPNGSTVPTKTIHGTPISTNQERDIHWTDNASVSGELPTEQYPGYGRYVAFHAKKVDGDVPGVHVFLEVPTEGEEEWAWEWVTTLGVDYVFTGVREPSDTFHYYHERIYDEIDLVKSNIDPLVNDTVETYEPGELDTSEVLSPVELASRASTDYNSTGYYSFYSAQLAMMGYAGNVSHAHTIEYGSELYNGTLFYTGDDLSILDTGATYHPSEYAGDFVMAYQVDENTSDILELEDQFTIVEQTDTKRGETVGNTTLETYTYNSTNSSDLAEELDRLSEARQEITGQTSTNEGSAGLFDGIRFSFGNLLGGPPLGILLVGAAVVVFLIGRGT